MKGCKSSFATKFALKKHMDRIHSWKLFKSSNVTSDNIISSKRKIQEPNSFKSSNVSSDNIILSKRNPNKVTIFSNLTGYGTYVVETDKKTAKGQ